MLMFVNEVPDPVWKVTFNGTPFESKKSTRNVRVFCDGFSITIPLLQPPLVAYCARISAPLPPTEVEICGKNCPAGVVFETRTFTPAMGASVKDELGELVMFSALLLEF